MKQIQFKIEKGRLLVPVGEPCPFGCRYCYTRGGEVGPSRVNPNLIIESLETFISQCSPEDMRELETLQFGYDGDPFARPDRGLELLEKLVKFKKHINFSTKALIQASTLERLKLIQKDMREHGTILTALVSLSCWDSSQFIEPYTPSPSERMETIRNLRSIGIPVLIAMRPIIPSVSDTEYEMMADQGQQAQCDGFVLGPLYADDKGQFTRFISPTVLQNIPKQKVKVSWSAHEPIWGRYEDETRLKRITAMIEGKGGKVFTSSAIAMHILIRESLVIL